MIRAGAPGRPAAARSAAALATGRNSGTVRTKRASASASCVATSPEVHSGLIPVTTPRAANAPQQASSHSGEFGAMIANTFPGRSPSAASPEATRRTPSASSA